MFPGIGGASVVTVVAVSGAASNNSVAAVSVAVSNSIVVVVIVAVVSGVSVSGSTCVVTLPEKNKVRYYIALSSM